jgi:hypothetical protein
MELHELHRRRLEATISLVEDGLERVEQLLRASGRSGIVRAVEDNLGAEERASLLEQVRRLRSELGAFAARFALGRHPVDIRQVCNAELSSAWVMIENCRPKRMKGFGVEMPPEMRAELEAGVEKLLAAVQSLRAALR